jgi:hypothetical protein
MAGRGSGRRAAGYVTADPDPSDRVDLATHDGRHALVLDDGCDGVEPGVNMLRSTDEAGGLMLQVIDPILGLQDQACSVLERECMGDTPCGKNPAGECDMAWS